MQVRKLMSIGILSLGFVATPAIPAVLRAAEPAKERPTQRGPLDFLSHYRETIDKLNLTADQKPTVDAAFADARTKAEAVTKDSNGDHAAMREKMQPIIHELTTKIIAVLTDDQKAQLKKLSEAHRRPGAGNDAK